MDQVSGCEGKKKKILDCASAWVHLYSTNYRVHANTLKLRNGCWIHCAMSMVLYMTRARIHHQQMACTHHGHPLM